MNRAIKLGGPGLIRGHGFDFEIPHDRLLPWIAELALLLGDWYDVQQTKVLFDDEWSVTFRVDSKIDPSKAAFKRLGNRSLRCDLAPNQAEYFQATLLRAYRDGMAGTDHIHIEGLLDGEHFDLTPTFDVVAPPLSAEEAARLILGGKKRRKRK